MLAVFVISGLALAPLVISAAGGSSAVPSASNMSAKSGDMPCCPDEEKSKDCQDCPLIAICALKTTQAGPFLTAALPLRHAIRTMHSVLNDAPSDGLSRPPPDHPPRNLA
jgi:hypothetical protein